MKAISSRRYGWELGCALSLYAVLLFFSKLAKPSLLALGIPPLPITLLPMLGVLAALWATMRYVRALDELQKRIQFEAISFAFAGTALGTLLLAFGEGAGLPHLSLFTVWPMMAILWLIGGIIAKRRYQ